MTLSGREYLKYNQSCVYIWWRDTKCLYVGCAMRGFRRIFNEHQTLNVFDNVRDNDRIEFIWYPQAGKCLKEIERRWIRRLKPAYNNTSLRAKIVAARKTGLIREALEMLQEASYEQR